MNTMPDAYPVSAVSLADGLNSYLNKVNSFPLLSQEEEQALFVRFQRDNDLDAARKIVLSHLRFVVHIARSYSGYGLPIEDLIQEGSVGLMKSVKRFDTSRGVRLSSFAVHWIRAEIQEYILKNWKLVKVATTKAQRKLFFNLRKMKKKLAWLSKTDATLIAEDLAVDVADVHEMDSRLYQKDSAFDMSFGDRPLDDDENFVTAAVLEDHSNNPDVVLENYRIATDYSIALARALDQLDIREREILRRRWLNVDKATLNELANQYAISKERVRQIEIAAMKKVKRILEQQNLSDI